MTNKPFLMGKYNLDRLSIEEKEQLKEYVNSIKEIKKAIKEMLLKGDNNEVDEDTGGNQSTGKILNI
jgi:hypothetical protein